MSNPTNWLYMPHHKHKKFPLQSFLFPVITHLLSCGTEQVYKKQNSPIFHSNEKSFLSTKDTGSLNAITFNFKEAEKTSLAIAELQEFEKTRKVDVYLLQEIDEKGVEAIAKGLRLNHLYIPIVYNKLIKKNIGNAIMTKGTIKYPEN